MPDAVAARPGRVLALRLMQPDLVMNPDPPLLAPPGSGGSPLGVVVVAIVNEVRERNHVARVRTAASLPVPLQNHGFGALFGESLRDAVGEAAARSPWLRGPRVELARSTPGVTPDGDPSRTDIQAELILSLDGRTLIGWALVRHPDADAPRARYAQPVVYISAPIAAEAGEAAIRAWAADDFRALRAATRAAARELADMLRITYLDPMPISFETLPEVRLSTPEVFRSNGGPLPEPAVFPVLSADPRGRLVSGNATRVRAWVSGGFGVWTLVSAPLRPPAEPGAEDRPRDPGSPAAP